MVEILMSTYNGEEFLREQIDSILAQSYSDFVLRIRDDGSKDGTIALIQSYSDPRICFVEGKNVGPAASFFELLRDAVDADYFFFSDQDDIWYPDKLEKMLEVIRKYDHIPAMCFSDFIMIDQNGMMIGESYSSHASLQVAPGEVPVENILAQPYVFGCASVINKELAKLVMDPPESIEMHDCWISLTAAAVGKLIYIPDRTISHRFHSSNATGRQGQNAALTRLKRVTSGFSAQRENTKLRLHQVNLLLSCYGEVMHPQVKSMLSELSAAMSRGRIRTVFMLNKAGVRRQKVINTLFFYLTILGIKGEIR